MTIIPVRPTETEAVAIMQELDAELHLRYPGSLKHPVTPEALEDAGAYFVVAKEEGVIGCGAFRPLDPNCAEIKRMYVVPAARKQGVARSILRHLEEEISGRGFHSIVLETGFNQPEAIGLYVSEGYFPIPPFLHYVGNPISRCYAKRVVQ